MLKKILAFTGSLAFVWTLTATPALAVNATNGLIDAADASDYSTTTELPEVIGKVISVALSMLGVLFLILTIYAGFLWMTAAGDDKKIQTAKNILSAAVVGLVLILTAYTITNFVIGRLLVATGSGVLD